MPGDGGDDASLDALLHQARWPDLSPLALARLRDAALAESRRHRRRGIVRSWLGAAGAVAAAAAAIIVAVRVWRPPTVPQVVRSVATSPTTFTTTTTTAATTMSPNTIMVGREPTLYERAVVVANLPKRSKAPDRPVVAPGRAAATTVRRNATDVATKPLSTAQPLEVAIRSPRPDERARAEAALIARVASADAKIRSEAIALLAGYGSARSLPTLSRAAEDPSLTNVAMPGVARLAGLDAVASIALSSKAPAVRRAACAALLGSGDPDAVEAYLSFVLDPTRRNDALAALEAVPEVKAVPALVAELGNTRVDYRLAAARALAGTCNAGVHENGGNPDPLAPASPRTGPSFTAAALRRLLDHNLFRREVLAALLQCGDESARRYIAALRTDRSVDSELRALERQIAELFG